jgi:hypothetical protein
MHAESASAAAPAAIAMNGFIWISDRCGLKAQAALPACEAMIGGPA